MEVSYRSPVEGCDFENNRFLKDIKIHVSCGCMHRELCGILLLVLFLRVQPGVLVKFQKRFSHGLRLLRTKMCNGGDGVGGVIIISPLETTSKISARDSNQWMSFMEPTKHTEKYKSAYNIYQAKRELNPAYNSFHLRSYSLLLINLYNLSSFKEYWHSSELVWVEREWLASNGATE